MELIKKLFAHQSLTFDEARVLLKQIQEDAFNDEQLRLLLMSMSLKGVTSDEIAGFASVMRESAVKITPRSGVVVDTAGTGGDGLNTFNISTAAAFVIAGAGVPVAKHGNRAASGQSGSGSADVMSAMGVVLELPAAAVEECLNEIGIAFLFAPQFHRATARVAKIRREMNVKTIFNFLGPLTNPALVRRQLIGVYDGAMAPRMAAACQKLGGEHVWVVSSEDGADELSVTAITHVCELKNGEVREFELVPEELGFERAEISDLQGGDTETNVRILTEVLSGSDQSARRDAVVLNAAAGIFVSGLVSSFEHALRLAQDSIDEGAAHEKLRLLIETTRRLKSTVS